MKTPRNCPRLDDIALQNWLQQLRDDCNVLDKLRLLPEMEIRNLKVSHDTLFSIGNCQGAIVLRADSDYVNSYSSYKTGTNTTMMIRFENQGINVPISILIVR